MRSRHLRNGVAVAVWALVALPAAARGREGAEGGRGERDGLERRERDEMERRERRERRRQEMMERRARRTEPGTPFARPGGPGREPPPTMALSGDNFYVVTGRTIRQFDAMTLKEKNSAELPLPGAIVERMMISGQVIHDTTSSTIDVSHARSSAIGVGTFTKATSHALTSPLSCV